MMRFHVFGRIAEGFLVFENLVVFKIGKQHPGFGQFFQADLVFVQPFGVGFADEQILLFQFIIADDPALFHIDDKHFAGLQSSFFPDHFLIDGQDAGF